MKSRPVGFFMVFLIAIWPLAACSFGRDTNLTETIIVPEMGQAPFQKDGKCLDNSITIVGDGNRKNLDVTYAGERFSLAWTNYGTALDISSDSERYYGSGVVTIGTGEDAKTAPFTIQAPGKDHPLRKQILKINHNKEFGRDDVMAVTLCENRSATEALVTPTPTPSAPPRTTPADNATLR